MSKTKKITGKVTDATLKMITAKNGKPIIIEVDINDKEIALGYFKKPSLKIHSIAMGCYSVNPKTGEAKMTDMERFKNIVIENCWIAGDVRIKEDEFTCLSIAQKLMAMVERKAIRIKNV